MIVLLVYFIVLFYRIHLIMSTLKDMPYEIILHLMSFMKGNDIAQFCQENKTIHAICKQNKTKIAQYILKNDYGFTVFPHGYHYPKLLSYFRRLSSLASIVTPTRVTFLQKSIKDNQFSTFKFIVANMNINNHIDDILYDIAIENNIEALEYLIEQGIRFDDEQFIELCITAFLWRSERIIDYITIHFYEELRNEHLLICELLEEKGDWPMADYIRSLVSS